MSLAVGDVAFDGGPERCVGGDVVDVVRPHPSMRGGAADAAYGVRRRALLLGNRRSDGAMFGNGRLPNIAIISNQCLNYCKHYKAHPVG